MGVDISIQFVLWEESSVEEKKNPFNGSSRSVPYILELTQYSSWHMAVL